MFQTETGPGSNKVWMPGMANELAQGASALGKTCVAGKLHEIKKCTEVSYQIKEQVDICRN